MNVQLLHALNAFVARRDAVEDPVTAYVQASEALFAAIVVAALVLGGRRGARAAVAALASAAVALAVGQLVSHLWAEPRPFVAHPRLVDVLVPHGSDASFPSDHATAAFAIAASIWFRWRAAGAVALVLAALLAVGRVAVGVHYPIDVVAGAALGIAGAAAFWWSPLRRLTDAVADRVHAAIRSVAAVRPTA